MGGLGVRGPDCSLLCYLLSIDLKAGDSLPCMYTKENFITRFFDFYEKVNDLVTIFSLCNFIFNQQCIYYFLSVQMRKPRATCIRDGLKCQEYV